MRVSTEICWAGNNRFEVRLTLPDGTRLVMPCPEEGWCRAVAIRAKDLIVTETDVDRRKIRFI